MQKSKIEELKYCEFFINRLNKRYSLDYKVRPNNEKNKSYSEVDAWAISNSEPNLNIQVVTREKELREIESKLRRNPGKIFGPMDLNIKKWISIAILHKENHYPDSVKQNLILLITGDIGSLFNEDYAKEFFKPFRNSKFKGIYSVHLPAHDSNYLHNGQIIALKDIFGNQGITF